ncbi:MAG: NAD(P)-binding domain-containing protein, partial [Actinomycetota bacterium]|nr:NAD(P)-binding domain-containing protein [Actinomycetota bacterium]
MEVAVVGAGRVGTALAVLLQRAGHAVTAVAGREATPARAAEYLPGVPVLPEAEASLASELVLLAVP